MLLLILARLFGIDLDDLHLGIQKLIELAEKLHHHL